MNKKLVNAVILGLMLGLAQVLVSQARADNPASLGPELSSSQIQPDLTSTAPADPTPARSEPGYQDLRPGQAADPALRLPPPPAPYDIRRQRTDGSWLGVTERELADGHLVEVHVSGSAQDLGQEVISRPTGHKVYRYYSGQK
ncbi:MAG: hypothetical protein LBC90_09860 [Candidatus Adiutrix sp.]|nr:hypothetical protein [Candidatus Adiutrix sp.]